MVCGTGKNYHIGLLLENTMEMRFKKTMRISALHSVHHSLPWIDTLGGVCAINHSLLDSIVSSPYPFYPAFIENVRQTCLQQRQVLSPAQRLEHDSRAEAMRENLKAKSKSPYISISIKIIFIAILDNWVEPKFVNGSRWRHLRILWTHSLSRQRINQSLIQRLR